jgi:uncharacterized protein
MRAGSGYGVPKHTVIAAHWWRKAAEQGNVGVQKLVGEIYRDGNGVPKDDVWFNLAAASNHETAQWERDTLAARMVPAQIAEAQQLSREWKPK